ncbi:Crp/Fnr family transcriptional regulator [Dokdonia pacifica]|uniref:cAMP-binding domain of CRP or a regulatory subunit of cAMP-dependent protein kinases n=1 Tax=Dokdonia pacifica TaxID=1627892 RepID=A0A238ZRM5_9FLAO|nr:Crp/Fnr family transcriptional regulator [Dokdonia pacifica]GGG07944.1 Crp/Fnr family transcriptional regulator [Dokdonia pacifica]SNR85598.1 cAMP-binding domain of CRP or a regulatory subunit of cAMP-dependent protein kinases [Dokdonia pacifica]
MIENAIQILKDKIATASLWEHELEFKRDTCIKEAGTIDTNLYFLEDGSARVYITEEAKEHIMYFGYKNSLLSAIDSFLTDAPSKLCIKTIKKTTVKVISKSQFLQFIEKEKETLSLWQQVLFQLLLMRVDREKTLLLNSSKARYEQTLEMYPTLFQEIPHRYIASYLRMTPETLSRIQKS